MKENEDQPKRVSTCFEGSPCAELMQEVLSEGGIGSLCEEMMRAMANRSEGAQQQPREDKRPARDGKTDREPQAAPSRNKSQNPGGVK
jgi:hypothetical protein